jgi:hypothetical protein
MFQEKLKLAVLLGSYIFCVLTLFTSHKSFQMGPRDLPILKPQPQRFCSSVFRSQTRCQKDPQSSDQCPKINHQASQCEAAVRQAYRKINAGGCPYELREVTLCELERCGGYHGISVLESQNSNNRNKNGMMDAVEGCMHHCDAARKQLDKCVLDIVEKKLQKYGIKIQQR